MSLIPITQSNVLYLSATATIDCDALRHNLQQARRLAPNSRIMAIVKANAYGHGLLEVAKVLRHADGYGVARLGEALQLRSGGITKPVLVLNGFLSAEQLTLMSANNIDTVAHTAEQLTTLEEASLTSPISVWLDVDAGMHRQGFSPKQAETAYKRLRHCKNVKPDVVIMSHFSRSDDVTTDDTKIQTRRFDEFVAGKPSPQSLSASAGLLLWPTSIRDWVRPGALLYGISPPSDKTGATFNLRPVMTFRSRLMAVRDHAAGEPVGYGGTWRSARDTLLGMIPVGYGDGYPRGATNGTPVLVNGRRVPLVGRVSMDSIIVELGEGCEEKVGDEVVLWGEGLPVEVVAMHAGTNGYELVTRLMDRVQRVYVSCTERKTETCSCSHT